jgi:proteic killer suppression protein
VPTDVGDRDEQFSVVLTRNWRLIFEINHDPIPRLEDGGIDLEKATAIRFVEVVDYHGN